MIIKAHCEKINEADSCFIELKWETELSHALYIMFHRSLAEAIRLHHPDMPEGDAMDTG